MRERVAVITGASRGIGAGLAYELNRQGLRLGLCSRSAPALASAEDVLAESLDVADESAVTGFGDAVVSRFGHIDLWINNAGVLEPIDPLRDVETADFWRHQEINLLGVFLGTRTFVRHLRSREGEGVLINVSSGAARKAYHGWSTYCAAKAAVDRLTECVQLEEAEAGLRAYSVAPGVADTEMQSAIRACTESQFADVEHFRQMKRDDAYNTPTYIATELLALAFDPARRPDEVLVRLDPEPR